MLRRILDAGGAAIALVIADLAVRILPFRVIAKRLRAEVRAKSSDASFAIARVKWAIDAAQRRIPWTIPCLATAVAANRMLAHRGVASEIRFGVQSSPDSGINAHAWLVAADVVIVGGDEREYVTLESTTGR